MTEVHASRVETVQQNWSAALQSYRSALIAYRRCLEMRTQRAVQRQTQIVTTRILEPVRPPAVPSRLDAQLECLTNRQREVAKLIARGYSNQQIADELVLTRGTVANHVAHVLAKLGATNRTQVAARVLERVDDRRSGNVSILVAD